MKNLEHLKNLRNSTCMIGFAGDVLLLRAPLKGENYDLLARIFN